MFLILLFNSWIFSWSKLLNSPLPVGSMTPANNSLFIIIMLYEQKNIRPWWITYVEFQSVVSYSVLKLYKVLFNLTKSEKQKMELTAGVIVARVGFIVLSSFSILEITKSILLRQQHEWPLLILSLQTVICGALLNVMVREVVLTYI